MNTGVPENKLPIGPLPGDQGPNYATYVKYDASGKLVDRKADLKESSANYFTNGYVLETKELAQKNATFQPKNVLPGSDFVDAYNQPSSLPSYFGQKFGNVESLQGQYNTTREAQNTNVKDLTSARTEEGLTGAQTQLNDINKRIGAFNTTIENMENDVRNDLGPGASESFIQAEVQRRAKDLQPEGNRLLQEQAAAQANYQMTVDRTNEKFTAFRNDANETINRVSQRLGFATDNINTAMTLFQNLKQYELLTDAQANQKRDDARAVMSLYISSPSSLKGLSDADLTRLATDAQISPTALKEIKTAVLTQGSAVAQAIGKSGELNMLFWDPKANAYAVKTWNNFGTVSTAGSSATNAKLLSNLSSSAQRIFAAGNTIQNQVAAVPENVRRQAATGAAIAVNNQLLAAQSQGLVTAADWEYYNKVYIPSLQMAAGMPDAYTSTYSKGVAQTDIDLSAIEQFTSAYSSQVNQ